MTASYPGSVKNFGADRVDGEYIPASDMNGVRAEVVAIESALDAVWRSGWVLADWAGLTRTGATTFTTSSNVSAVVQKGDKLRFMDPATKYLNVVSAVWAGGVTTITTIANNDYALVGHPSAMYYSKVENPQGWPGWFNYSPVIVWTAGTAPINPGSTFQQYAIFGNTCIVNVYNFSYTAGVNVSSATITLPVLPATYNPAMGAITVSNTPNLSIADTNTTTGRVYCSAVAATAIRFSASYRY